MLNPPKFQKFEDLDILPSLKSTLAELKIIAPTEIQQRALPALLAGRSVIGVSETGSGKTLAYALPALHLLKTLETEGSLVTQESRPRAAIIVPTRELGEQATRVLKQFTHSTRLRVRSVLGGTALTVARRNVAGPFEILVATPGRLIQMMDRHQVNLTDVRFLAFDEADQMLDAGFLPDANRIAAACKADRQLAMFSATVSPVVQSLMKELFKDAQVIHSQGHHRVVPTLKTVNCRVVNGKRFPLLENLLAKKTDSGTIIFTNTREQCDELVKLLHEKKHACLVYRGEMDKVERRSNLKAFREGKIDLLVSTDLASRGLDVEHVGRVINYHLPQGMENYLHRVGRTARAGRSGTVVNLVTERDAPLMAQIDKRLYS